MNTPSVNAQLRKHLWIMFAVVVGMFGFCFAMVPLYNVICKATGLNGKTGGQVQVTQTEIDTSRIVTVELTSTLNESLPGEFYSQHKKFSLHPGETVSTSYWVKNLTDKPMVVQAIPSVTPGLAADHIKKVECFCFQKQPLAPGEGKWMPLVFTVDPALSKRIQTMTLAYTLFNVTEL